VSTLAGSGTEGFLDGPVAKAQFAQPYGLAVGSAGKIYIVESNNHAIRVINPP